MGGRQAIDEIRRIDPGVRAIVSSGYSNDPIMADFQSHGFRAALVKPYKPQELGQVLRDLVEA